MIRDHLPSLWHVARVLHPGSSWAEPGRRLLFVFRHLRSPRLSAQWLEFLATTRLAPVARENPSLYRKPIRPYVSLRWPAATRVAAMIHHYEFLARVVEPEIFGRIASPAGAVLLSFPARTGDHFTVRLRYDAKFRKEGEVTVDLDSAMLGDRVSSLTFVVAAGAAGLPCLVIGAVSGLPAGADKDIIKHTTKALFGLRPKALLLLVVQELAQAWGIPVLLGVGSRVHPSRHLIYRLNHRRRFPIAYDDFWREMGGRRRNDGLFALPLATPTRDLREIESHKRSLYRHRQTLTAALQAQLRASLRDWRTAPAPRMVPVVIRAHGPGPAHAVEDLQPSPADGQELLSSGSHSATPRPSSLHP